LLIYLPQRLPQDFTIEVDLVPKACCPPPDLTLEGTGIINQGQSSAHLLLVTDADHGFVSVIGGAADTYEQALPELIRAALPGVLTRVGVSVAGNTIRFYINGKPIYAHQASFARGHVLRVTLGGSTDDQGAVKPVYLARVRVATGATLVTAINPGTATVTPILPPPAPQPSSPVAPAARTIDLNALTATGTGLRAPVILLPGMQAAGTSTTPARTPFTPATQTIALPPWIGSGGSASIAPRSIALPAFTASAGSTGLRPRTIQLPAFTASGSGPP
jgi:hypothetical protein